MEKTITVPKQHQGSKIGIILCSFYLVCGIILLIFTLIGKENFSEKNQITYTGNIVEVSQDTKDDDYYLFVLEDNPVHFSLRENLVRENQLTDKILPGMEVTFTVSKKTTEKTHTLIIRIEDSANTIHYDFTSDYANNDRIGLIVSSVLMGVSSVGLAISIFFRLRKSMVTLNIHDTIIAPLPWLFLPGGDTYQYNINHKKRNRYAIFYLICVLIACAFLVLGGIEGNKDNPSILLVSIYFPIAGAFFFIPGILSFLLFNNRYHREKKIAVFAKDVKKYYSLENTMEEFCPFDEEGLPSSAVMDIDMQEFSDPEDGEEMENDWLKSDHSPRIPLDQLNLYVSVCYTNRCPMYASIYLCSELDDSYDHDLYIPLNSKVYRYLVSHHIDVRGMDWVMNHLEQELSKNDPKGKQKPLIVDYKNEMENSYDY